MLRTKHRGALDWLLALALWALLALSLGLYYSITYYGHRGWPLPHPETLGAGLLYYFTVLNVSTPAQAVHWMLAFPLAGVLWAVVLTVLGPHFGGRSTSAAKNARSRRLLLLAFLPGSAAPALWDF